MLVAHYYVAELVSGTPVLYVLGEIDECGIDAFTAAITEAERDATCGLIVELGEANLWCTAAYSSVIAAAARLGACGKGPLVVVCPSDHLASRVFSVLHFEHRCVETLVAAVACLRCDRASVAATYAERFLQAEVS